MDRKDYMCVSYSVLKGRGSLWAGKKSEPKAFTFKALKRVYKLDTRVKQTSPFKAGWGFGSLWFLTSGCSLLRGWVVHLWVKCLKG
jgi:hypothetical protein